MHIYVNVTGVFHNFKKNALSTTQKRAPCFSFTNQSILLYIYKRLVYTIYNISIHYDKFFPGTVVVYEVYVIKRGRSLCALFFMWAPIRTASLNWRQISASSDFRSCRNVKS